MDRVVSTLIGVVIAVGTSAVIFIGINKLFDVAPRRWQWFTTLLGASGSLVTFLILWGNRVIEQPLLWTCAATVVGGVVGFLLGQFEDIWPRLAVGAVGGGILGLFVGLNMRDFILVFPDGNTTTQVGTPIPALNYGETLIWVAAIAAIGAGIWALRGRRKPLVRSLVFWASVGWGLGVFAGGDLGTANRQNALVACIVLGVGIGASLGLIPFTGERRRVQIEAGSRKYIFLAPALFFIGASLVVPTIRTFWLSFLDRTGDEAVGFANYSEVFTDANIINVSNWTGIFGSALFQFGLAFIVLGFVAAYFISARRGDEGMAFGAGTLSPIVIGTFVIAMAVFATLRGTIINNLWWVFTVTAVATSMGLAIAVLADRGKYENIAKSIIFMPMAISFVGAGIIWRFMYIARPSVRDQTGVMNSLWVALGQISNSGTGQTVVTIILGAAAAGLGYLAWRGWKAGANGVAVGSIVTALPLLWLMYRFLGPGLGGFTVNEVTGAVSGEPILFTSEVPFNNIWLMVVLVWIQTGFTMVIFSSAIKAVPEELIEAARVDGATESQTFWRVTIPQIAPTIGVVVTTLIVTVMKVFDIVRVMTAGNFDTNVIANEMYDKAFAEFNFGVGSALAVVLFLAILPIMFYNIRRMQKAAI